MPKRIDVVWEKMWELRDKIDLETACKTVFQKMAEDNDEMRELLSEYETLKNEEE